MSSDSRHVPSRLKHRDEIDEVFARANPNPGRAGCPGREVLIALAHRQRPIEDAAYDHLSKCSPCYLEIREIQQAAALQRSRRLLALAAAAVVVVTAALAWFFAAGNGGRAQTELAMLVDLRPYAQMRSDQRPDDRKPIVLPRGRVALTMLLPVGSEPGPYDIQIRDSQLISRAPSRGEAEFRDKMTTLRCSLDLGALSAGTYQLAIRHNGDDWQLFPAQVR
jgi:hypothetical protein